MVWKHGEWLGFKLEDDGQVTHWRFPPHQWDVNMTPYMQPILYVGGRADYNDFKFPGHIETILFQTGICTEQVPLSVEPTCRMACQGNPESVTFALFHEPYDLFDLVIYAIVAPMNDLLATPTTGPSMSSVAYLGRSIATMTQAHAQTFTQVRQVITAIFGMMTGPLIVEAVGDGHTTSMEEMKVVDPGEPLGKGTVLDYVSSKLGTETHHVILLPERRAGDGKVPLVRMTMKLLKPACRHPAQ